MNNPIYTIGHSIHSEVAFLDLLEQNHINAIADVRSNPYSEYTTWFNREKLAVHLKSKGIRYVFLGKELGGRGTSSERNPIGKVIYNEIAKTKSFNSGLERIRKGSKTYRLALMCSEGNPIICHRALLVAKKLVEDGFEVIHILENGKCENHHPDTEDRIIELHQQGDFLIDNPRDSRENHLKFAYEKQADVSYKAKKR